jgi:phage portal protein BeeE
VKDYMNAHEQQSYLMASAAVTAVGTVLDRVSGRLQKEALADLRRGRAFIERALRTWIKPVNQRTREILMRKSAGVTIGVINDTAMQATHKEFLRYMKRIRDEVYQEEGRDYVYDLAEVAMAAACPGCNGAPKATCPVYEALHNLYIEPWDANHPRCEYAGSGAV